MKDSLLTMKKPTEADLTIVYWGLIDNPHLVYSKFINVKPVKPPYSKTLRPNRFYLETRRGWRDRMSSIIVSIKNDDCDELYKIRYTWEQFNKDFFWTFTDVITLVETIDWDQVPFEYWMRISQDKLTLKIFKSQDWCHLMEIISDCFCPCGIERFVPINFLKWKPRSLFRDTAWDIVAINWSTYDWDCWIQTNYTFLEQRASLADITSTDVDWSSTYWNFWNWVNAIQPWDFMYTYSIDKWCTTNRSGICWQTNTITWLNPDDNKKLMVSNYWNGFEPGQLDPAKRDDVNSYNNIYGTIEWLDDSYYVPGREPQTEWYNMDYMVFPEYGETFAYQSCWWLKAYHYHNYTDNCNEAVVTNFCNFEGCFTNSVLYTWRNWVAHLVSLSSIFSAITYSDWWNLAYLSSWNIVPVRKNTLGMTSFQNYVVYFWKQHIWAFYIDLQQDVSTGVNRYVAKWNIIRNNLWSWVNPDWKIEAYDEYDNSFYFLWSNKRLYALSIIPSETWVLVSKLEDMTDNEWGKWIIWDLENIDESDYVYIQADDDNFRVFINSSSNNNWVPNKTKILTYWKRYKFWTTDISCAAVVSKEVSWLCGKYLLWKEVYDRCGDFDVNEVPVEYMIQVHLWEDEATRIQWNHSFNRKYLDYIKTQVGKTSRRVLWDSRLDIYWYKDWLQFKKTIDWLFDAEYLKTIENINKWQKAEVSLCMVQDLNDCEYFFEECKSDTTIQYDNELANIPRDSNELIKLCNWYDYRTCYNQCACPKEKKVDDHCFCIDDKKYHISPFVNLFTDIDMKAEMYTIQLRWHDKISFWWFFIGIYNWASPMEVNDCNKRNCEWCTNTQKYANNKKSCF